MTFGDRIKEVQKPLNQKGFAEELKVHVNTVQKWEKGQTPSGTQLKKIHAVHQDKLVNLTYLLTGLGVPFIYEGMEQPEGDNVMMVRQATPSYNASQPEKPPADSSCRFKLSDALTMAARVLESNTTYADALYLNIQHFDRAIRAEARIFQLETECVALNEKNDALEKRISALEAKPSENDQRKDPAEEPGEKKAA